MVKRYRPNYSISGIFGIMVEMEPDNDGCYVAYSDYLALLAHAAAIDDELTKTQVLLSKLRHDNGEH